MPEGQRPAQDGSIHRSDAWDCEQIAHDTAGKSGTPLAGDHVEDRRDPVRRHQDFDFLPLRRSPKGPRCLREGGPVENEVEHNVDIDEEPLQRYFRSR
jgi:hypothetical protein